MWSHPWCRSVVHPDQESRPWAKPWQRRGERGANPGTIPQTTWSCWRPRLAGPSWCSTRRVLQTSSQAGRNRGPPAGHAPRRPPGQGPHDRPRRAAALRDARPQPLQRVARRDRAEVAGGDRRRAPRPFTDVPLDPAGLFENLHGFESGVAILAEIRRVAGEHHGVAGPEFLRPLAEHVRRDRRDIVEWLDDRLDYYLRTARHGGPFSQSRPRARAPEVRDDLCGGCSSDQP